MDPSFVPYRLAGEYLSRRIQETNGDIDWPVIGIICGSGLSELSSSMTRTLTIPYADIPGFPAHCTVAGHKGELVLGRLGTGTGGTPCICFRGRFHSYEGHDMKTVVLPVYVMRCLHKPVPIVIITHAAGGLNASYNVGDICAISDHLAIPQLAGKNALIGPNDDELGPRFPATSNAYPETLRLVAQQAANDLPGFDTFFRSHATYCFVSGPMYESKAECRLLRSLGGDAVGMSTIPEVVAAHHCEMQVLCLSLITNKVVMTGDSGEAVASHAEVLEAVAQRSVQMQALVQQIVRRLTDQVVPNLAPLRQVNLAVPKHLNNQSKKTILPQLDQDSSSRILLLRTVGVASLVFAAGLFLGYRQGKPRSTR